MKDDALQHPPGLSGGSHSAKNTLRLLYNHVLNSMTLVLSYPSHLLGTTGHHRLGVKPNEAERGQVLSLWARRPTATSAAGKGKTIVRMRFQIIPFGIFDDSCRVMEHF